MLKTWLARLLPLWGTLFALLVLVPLLGVAIKYSNWIATGVLPDFREGRVSAIQSIPVWLRRSQMIFLNSISQFQEDKSGLPVVHLFIPERSRQSLLSNLPLSSKIYQPAQMLFPDGKIRKVKVRIRGDNGRNYLLEKKSWRIKTRKSNLYHGSRVASFHVPRSAIPIESTAAYTVAQNLGLVTPDVSLVELNINGSSNGVFVRYLHLNEEFLRNHDFMPVDLFKADREIGDEHSNTPRIWQNIAQWQVLAKSGRYDKERYLLRHGLDLSNAAVFDEQSFKKLGRVFPVDVWATFAVQDILLQNFHTGHHNVRVIADDQSGLITPIIWDPIIEFNDKRLEFSSLIGECRVPIVCLFKQSSVFRKREFEILYKAVKDNILQRVASEIEQDLDPLVRSVNRDAFRFDVEPHRSDIFGTTTRASVLEFTDQLRAREKWLMEMLEREPQVSWNAQVGGIELDIKGSIPIDQIDLIGAGVDNTRSVYYDKNNNGEVDAFDTLVPSYASDDGVLRIDVSLFANGTGQKYNVPTRFKFILDSSTEITDVNVRQFLTKNRYQATKGNEDYRLASSRNTPIISERNLDLRKIRNILEIKKTLVTEEPYLFMPGSGLILHPGVSVIFREKVEFRGSQDQPITITSRSEDPFGVVAIHGNRASGSSIQHVTIKNGSQSRVSGTSYLGMLSIHDSSNIVVENLRSLANSGADDMFHVVYGRNIVLRNSEFLNAEFDAIDVDLSTIEAEGLMIDNAGNDCIDVMGGYVHFRRLNLRRCGDKGISIGEKSKATIDQTIVEATGTGVAAKDGSIVSISNSRFNGNSIHLHSFRKNWRYGKSIANITVRDSKFLGQRSHFQADKFSSIVVEESQIPSGYTTKGNVVLKR